MSQQDAERGRLVDAHRSDLCVEDMAERIVRYVIHDLPAEEAKEVEQHIRRCHRCYAKLVALEVVFETDIAGGITRENMRDAVASQGQ